MQAYFVQLVHLEAAIVHVFFDIRMMHHDGLKLRKFNNKFILKPFGTLRRGTLRVQPYNCGLEQDKMIEKLKEDVLFGERKKAVLSAIK